MKRFPILCLFIITAMAFSASSASAASLLLDNFSGHASSSPSDRVSEFSPGSLISVSTNQTLTNISVLNDLDSDGSMKFLIFDHSDHSLLFESSAQSFTDDGMTWKMSDAFSFNLQAGKEYDVGAIADVSGDWAFDQVSESQNGITTIVTNPNFSDFSDPVQSGHASADAAVRFYAEGESTVIPTPAAAPAGLLLLGGVLLRRRRRAAA